jgi:hypothetical protein
MTALIESMLFSSVGGSEGRFDGVVTAPALV